MIAVLLYTALALSTPSSVLAAQILNGATLSAAETTFLTNNNPFTLCVDPAFMPYERINDQGKHEGIFADFLSLIAAKSGVKFLLVPTTDYPQSREFFQQGKCNVIAGDTVPTTEVNYLATKPYFLAESAFAVLASQPDNLDFAKIANKRTGYIEGADLSIVKKNYPGITLIGVESDLVGIREVASGELDSFISTVASIDYVIRNHGITNVKLGGKINDHVDFAMLVNKQLPLLVDILNKGIDDITYQERQTIIKNWFHPLYLRKSEYQRYWILLSVAALILAVLLIRYILQLRRNRLLSQVLFRNEIRFQNLVENSHDWIWEINEKYHYVYASPRIKDFLGFEPSEILGRTPFDLMSSDDTECPNQSLHYFMEKRQSFNTLETVMLHRNGKKVILESSGTPIFDEHSVFLGYRGSDRDITERKVTEQELTRYRTHLETMVAERTAELEITNRELEAFSYSVSHDLRAPLRAIDGFSQLILDDYSDAVDDAGRDFLSRIREGAQNMGILIDTLISLSRVSRVDFKPEDIDLSTQIKSIVNKYKRAEPERKIDVKIMPDVHCFADKRLVAVLLDNLISNAWKYTRKKNNARLEFGEKKMGGRNVFFIRDNGVGFDMKYANKLFGAFQRLHEPSEFEGTGIGLATVLRIIQRHSGEIWAEAWPDRGAVFYFTLDKRKTDGSALTKTRTRKDLDNVDKVLPRSN